MLKIESWNLLYAPHRPTILISRKPMCGTVIVVLELAAHRGEGSRAPPGWYGVSGVPSPRLFCKKNVLKKPFDYKRILRLTWNNQTDYVYYGNKSLM
jgi:hypothetical protein